MQEKKAGYRLEYRFSVRAFKRVNGKNFRSAYSAPFKVRTEKVKYSKAVRIIIDTEGQDWKLLVVNTNRNPSRPSLT